MRGEQEALRRDAELHYWRRFPVTINFHAPLEVVGQVVNLGEMSTRDGPVPKLKIVLDDGFHVYVVAHQARLLAELVEKRPAEGDRIRIVYRGEAPNAAPGMNPAKEFSVAVRRPEPEQQKAAS